MNRTTTELYERLKILNQMKHKGSRSRRVTSIEREIGQIKRELNKRKRVYYEKRN